MPRPKSKEPSYCLHKSSGRAYCTLGGKPVYLGQHGTPESRDEYHRVLAEWSLRGKPTGPITEPESLDKGITISQLVASFWLHAQTYYRDAQGKPTGELDNFKSAVKFLARLYGNTPASEFGPLKLKAVRQAMIEPTSDVDPITGQKTTRPGWARKNANKQISRIKLVFAWGESEEKIAKGIYASLISVKGLKAGRSDARETDRVLPVPEAYVDAVRRWVAPQVEAMIDLQLLTGMRPGEVCQMRGRDIDTTGKQWEYTPPKHKNLYRGHDRKVPIGPKARAIIEAFLKPDLTAYLFSPEDAATWHRKRRHEARATPIGQGNRPGSKRASRRTRPPGKVYDVAAYRRALARAADWANRWAKGGNICSNDERLIPRWHPHQLRHNAATRLRKEYGAEVSRIVLGQRSLATTEIYAEPDFERAREIMAIVG